MDGQNLLVLTLLGSLVISGQDVDHKSIGSTFITHVLDGRSCPRIGLLIGGKVKDKMNGKLVHFICRRGSVLVGERYSVCVSGRWSHDTPVCATNDCPIHPPPVEDGIIRTVLNEQANKQTAYQYGCQRGYHGDDVIVYCNNLRWLGIPNSCFKIQGESCDFEDEVTPLCGWDNDDDHDIDWVLHTDETITEGTGPNNDHTKGPQGNGHYIYVNSSMTSPGSVARLYTDDFYPEQDWCISFWYHMYGTDADATLILSTATTEMMEQGDFEPFFILEGNHGNQWNYAVPALPKQTQRFRVIFQATMNTSRRNDIALDDVSILPCYDVTSPVPVRVPSTLPASSDSTFEAEKQASTFVSSEPTTDVFMMAEESQQLENTTSEDHTHRNLKHTTPKSSETLTLAIGISIAVGIVLLVLVVLLCKLVKKKKSEGSLEDLDTQAFAYTQVTSDSPL